MRSRVFATLFTFGLVAIVATTACSVTTTSTDPGGTGPTGSSETPTEPSDPELSGIVAAHNEVRAGVSPAPASPLGKLAWSEEDAAVARAYAEKCVFTHNKDRGNRGENLYASSGSSSPVEVVKSWASEVSDYDYATNKCSEVCGHYTQIVWGATTHVGCAKKTCTANNPFGKGSWEIWVCNYSPPGNFVGKKPY